MLQALRTCRPTVEDQISAIELLDLEMVRRKLMEEVPEGKSWTEKQARLAETWYRRFLVLHVKYPEGKHVPNAPIDAFWHQHILDTERYGTDCEEIFWHFLHHFPYFGLNGDAAERDAAFDETNRLYEREFGENCFVMLPHYGEETFGKKGHVVKGQGCNHSGSGTGCGQGCSRGK